MPTCFGDGHHHHQGCPNPRTKTLFLKVLYLIMPRGEFTMYAWEGTQIRVTAYWFVGLDFPDDGDRHRNMLACLSFMWPCIVTSSYNKPIRWTNFSNLFLEWNSASFRQFLCPSSRVFHCTHSNGICHTDLLTACKQDQDGTLSFWSCSQAVSKLVWHIPLLCVQWKTPDNGQRNFPKHV